jgi:hypothetical protein
MLPRPADRYAKLAVGVIALYALLGLLTLTSMPPVHYLGDELGNIQHGAGYIQSMSSGLNADNVLKPRAFSTLLWLTQAVLGPGIWQSRLLVHLTSVLSLALLWLLGAELGSRRAALWGVAMAATSFLFNWNARLVRPESVTILLVLAMLWLLVRGRSGPGRYTLYAGALAALSVNVHPNNAQYIVGLAPVVLALAWPRADSPAGRRLTALARPLGLYAGGVLLGCAYWWLAVYAPTQAPAVASAGGSGVGRALTGIYGFPFMKENIFGLAWESLLRFPGDYAFTYAKFADRVFPNTVSFGYFGVAMAGVIACGLAAGHRRIIGLLLTFMGFTLYANYFLAARFGYWHMAEFVPVLCLCAALGADALTSRAEAFRPGWGRVAAAVLLASLVGVGLYNTALTTFRLSRYTYADLTRAITGPVPMGARTFAHHLYEPALRQGFVTYAYDVDNPYRTCRPFRQVLHDAHPRFVVFDDVLRGSMRSACGPDYEQDALRAVLATGRAVATLQLAYPNYWAPGRMIREAVIVEMPE